MGEALVSGSSFNFCMAMRQFCVDVCLRHSEFQHIDMSRVVVTYAQARSSVEWGMQAKLTPMRFERGQMTEQRDGQTFTVQRVFHNQKEMLYILTFYLPRFLNQSYMEKLVTVFHELYHISPQFNGDIRRFSGPCYMHTGSQAEYDRLMARFVRQYLRGGAPESLRRFMKFDFQSLQKSFGQVVGLRIPIPRIIRVDDAA